MKLGLEDKHFLVTGGAGAIGSAIVTVLAKENARITLHYHSSSGKAHSLQDKLGKRTISLVKADLRDEKQVKSMFDSAISNFGRIDGIVLNAGIWESDDILTAEMTLKQWNNTHKTNLTSVFLCVREFFKNLDKFPNEHGSIVMIGSTAGKFGEAGHADYSSTKAALMYGLTRTWKNEIIHYASRGRVNTVAPGWVLTPMAEDSLEKPDEVKKILQTIPLRKVANTMDIARSVVFLLSPVAAAHISGQTIMVDGGMEGRVLFTKNDIDVEIIEDMKKQL